MSYYYDFTFNFLNNIDLRNQMDQEDHVVPLWETNAAIPTLSSIQSNSTRNKVVDWGEEFDENAPLAYNKNALSNRKSTRPVAEGVREPGGWTEQEDSRLKELFKEHKGNPKLFHIISSILRCFPSS